MSRRWRGWAFYVLAWLPVAFGYAELLMRTRGFAPSIAIASASIYTISAALLGVLVWHLSGRVPWPTRRAGWFVAAQIAMSSAYTLLWHAAIVAHIATRTGIVDAIAIGNGFIAWQLLIGLWVYGLIAGVSYAMRITGRQRDREAAAARAESLRMHAELQALRGKLDPHFLFNTLRTVSALIREDPRTAQASLERFAALLRYVLDAKRVGQEDATLADELAFVRDYLSLEHLRLGDRLRVVEQIDLDALDCVIPSLTLQPLVENAIAHAFAPRGAAGTLTIGASLDGDELTLVIADDGPGAMEEGVRSSQGLGLRAGRQRLEMRYAKLARFTVTTAPGAGFAVTIMLPARVLVRPTPTSMAALARLG
jgi:two-component system LytT family sensor kinase